ncbi:hypothetical protein [Nonomuraea diastatica]|uniref:Uncharacterized protein n=1 Tax=Nonomuraea diastatica TaxID=1848329 RepID=A0A4R4WSB9_9ACTN|nr:hypothetical protein [Nonomuraea diastatica]TDD20464.1 hypothetical protein E1294_17805 [Nonomuraea diastatica]
MDDLGCQVAAWMASQGLLGPACGVPADDDRRARQESPVQDVGVHDEMQLAYLIVRGVLGGDGEAAHVDPAVADLGLHEEGEHVVAFRPRFGAAA